MNNQVLGKIGEDTAAIFLENKGYEILKRNYRCRYGEIDIIAQYKNEIDFIEVKTRSGTDYGRPCEAVNNEKKRHIRNASLNYLRESKPRGCSYGKVKFHVLEIIIEHIEDAF